VISNVIAGRLPDAEFQHEIDSCIFLVLLSLSELCAESI
jgi:hypothetical protein